MPGPNSKVVFDIETLAYPFESFDAEQQAYLLKYAQNEEEKLETIERLSLGPMTARVIAIAMVNPESGKGQVFYDEPGAAPWASDDGLVDFQPCDEAGILTSFWQTIRRFQQFITFNGRGFDCPFLTIRSAMLGIAATRNLMPYRYSTKEHYDLLEQLTFFGASRKYSLDFVCRSFGVHSPKMDGITGKDVQKLHAEGRHRDIAQYCLGDVRATAELYKRWTSAVVQDER